MLKFSNKSVFKSEQWAYINYNLFNFYSWSKSERFTGLKKGLEIIFLLFFGVKILKFFDEDPGSGMETVRIWDPGWKKVGSGIRDKHPGSATLLNSSTVEKS